MDFGDENQDVGKQIKMQDLTFEKVSEKEKAYAPVI